MQHDLTSLLEELIRRWKEQEAEPRPGNSREAIRAFERREGVTLPDDFARYFEAVDGMDHIDHEVFCFWPLERVEPAERNWGGPPGYLVFADFLINSTAYGLRVSGGTPGEVFVCADGGPKLVASTFTEFLEKYLSDPYSVV